MLNCVASRSSMRTSREPMVEVKAGTVWVANHCLSLTIAWTATAWTAKGSASSSKVLFCGPSLKVVVCPGCLVLHDRESSPREIGKRCRHTPATFHHHTCSSHHPTQALPCARPNTVF